MNQTLSIKSKYSAWVYVLSGVLSGFVLSAGADTVFASWGPGLIFGFVFAICNFQKRSHIALYTILSGIIYRLSLQIGLTAIEHNIRISQIVSVVGWVIINLFGALGLVILTRQLSSTKPTLHEGIKTVFIGEIAGVAFWLIVTNLRVSYLSPALAFTVWQVPVAMSLAAGLQKQKVKSVAALPEELSSTDLPNEPQNSVPDLSHTLPDEIQPVAETVNEAEVASVAPDLVKIPAKAGQGSIVGWLFVIGAIMIVATVFVTNLPSNSSAGGSSRPKSELPSVANTSTPTPSPKVFNLKVDGNVVTDIQVKANDYVWVMATGKIPLGIVIGSVGPDGETGSMWQTYNIEKQFLYGSLLCRVEGEPWKFCGSDREIRFTKSGHLEFAINDHTIGSKRMNDSWDVQIIVSPYSYKSSVPPTATPEESDRNVWAYIEHWYDGCHATRDDGFGNITLRGSLFIKNKSNHPIRIGIGEDNFDTVLDYYLVLSGETIEIQVGGYFTNGNPPTCAVSIRPEWAK